MARSFSRNEQTYPAGTYGPFSVDSFTRDNASALELTLTVVGWPEIQELFRIVLTWESGGGATFVVGGAQRGIDGQIMPSVKFGVTIPRDATGAKRNVTAGTVVVTALAPVRTAITLQAV